LGELGSEPWFSFELLMEIGRRRIRTLTAFGRRNSRFEEDVRSDIRLGVCLVSIIGEHQRDYRELSELKRRIVTFVIKALAL